MADTYTANYNLVKIEQGSTGWAGKANGNMDTIDGIVFLKIGYDAFGNVGIGTLTPTTKLHVVSSINQGIMVSDGTTIGIMFPSSTLTNSLSIGTQSNHPLIFGTNNVFPRMIIDTSGNVGIGTSTPSSTLHVKQSFSGDLGIIFEGNTKTWGFLNTTDGSFSLKDFLTDRDRDLIDVVSGDRSFHKVNGSEIMRIANSGNVGIGTTSPGEKLEVSGAVKIGTASGTADGTVRWTGTDFEGRKGGAWVSLTTPALGYTAEDVSNKSTTETLGTSDTLYPSQKAVKSYVDTAQINTQTGTTYTFALTDAGKLVTFGSGSATTVTIDTFANVAFPTGTQIDCIQLGAGKVTFAGAGGVTLNSKGSNKAIGEQYVGVTLIKTDTNVWVLMGDLIA